MSRCPCSSGATYDTCCGPLHAGQKAAATAEQLMRSRYSAFALGLTDYLVETWHPDTRARTVADINAAVDAFDAASNSIGGAGDEAAAFVDALGVRVAELVETLTEVVDSAEAVLEESAGAASAARDAMSGPATAALQDARTVSRDLSRLINRIDRIARTVEQTPEQFVVGDPAPYED